MTTLLFIIESFLLYCSILLIANKILGKKIKILACLICCTFLYVPCILVGRYGNPVCFILVYALVQILQILSMKLTISNFKLSAIVGYYFFICCVHFMLNGIADCLLDRSKILFSYIEFALQLLLFFLIALVCFCNRLCFWVQQCLAVIPVKIKLLAAFSVMSDSLLISIILSNPLLDENTAWSMATRLSLVALTVLVCMMFPVLLMTTMTNFHLKIQNERFEHDIRAQSAHYLELAESNKTVHRFRHDFANIRIGLMKCLRDNNCRAAMHILEEEQKMLDEAIKEKIAFETGNGIVDAILADKQTKAKEHNIFIHFDGFVPSFAFSPVDLCVLFGNTLDNAVEACKKLPPDKEKIISVSSECAGGFVFVSVSNPVAEDVPIRNNMVNTTKSDRVLHGYGLSSLQKTAHKYDGYLTLSCKDRVFTVGIDLALADEAC